MEIREALESGLAAAEGATTDEAPISAPAEGAYAPAADSPTESAQAKADRIRDEQGRFAKADQKTSDQAPTPGLETAQSAPSIEPPQSWSAEMKAKFASLPPDVQQYTLQREMETHRRITELGANSERIQRENANITQVVQPYRQQWALKGFTPDQAIGQLVEYQAFLDRDPMQGILGLCQSYGIHPSQLLQAQPRIDPQVASVHQELSAIRQEIAQRDQMAEAAQISQLENVVNTFASETDQSGKPLRPHFEAISAELQPHIWAVRQEKPHLSANEVLSEAYDRAVYANPRTRQLVLNDQKVADDAKRQAEAQQKLRAGASLNGAPGANLVGNAPKDIRSLLEAGMNGNL